MDTKNILKHFLVIAGGIFIKLILGVISTPIITRIVDPYQYGQYSIFNMYASIALMFLLFGLDQSYVRFYYEHDNITYKKTLLAKCVTPPIIATIIIIIIFSLTFTLTSINFELDNRVMLLICVYVLIHVLYRFSLLTIRLNYNSKLYSFMNIFHKLTYILIAIPLILISKDNYLMLLIYATIGSEFLCLLYSILAQKKTWRESDNSTLNYEVSLKELLRYGYPYIIALGVTTLFQSIDKIYLNMYGSFSEVGVYASTLTLINVFAIVQTTFTTLWAPLAIQHFTDNQKDRSFYQKGNQIITVIMFFIGFTLIFGKDLFAILLGEKYRAAAHILPFLIFNPIMYTVSETTVSGLVFYKKSKLQVVVALGACISNIIGNALLVPSLGAKGAAISTGISYIVFFALRTLLSNVFFPVDFRLGSFYILTGVCALYALYNTFIEFNFFSIIGYLIGLATLYMLYKDEIKWCIKFSYARLKRINLGI